MKHRTVSLGRFAAAVVSLALLAVCAPAATPAQSVLGKTGDLKAAIAGPKTLYWTLDPEANRPRIVSEPVYWIDVTSVGSRTFTGVSVSIRFFNGGMANKIAIQTVAKVSAGSRLASGDCNPNREITHMIVCKVPRLQQRFRVGVALEFTAMPIELHGPLMTVSPLEVVVDVKAKEKELQSFNNRATAIAYWSQK